MKLWIGIVIVLVLIVIIVITIAVIRKRNKEKTRSASLETQPVEIRQDREAAINQLPDNNMVEQIKAKLANCDPSTLQKIGELLQV